MCVKITLVLTLFVTFVSCTRYDSAVPDELNRRAYLLRYKDVDSSFYYAQKAFTNSSEYPDGQAESFVHQAFVLYQQMQYTQASRELDKVDSFTNNQVVLLCVDVLRMKITQRTGELRTFYRAWHSAEQRLNRIDEEIHLLSKHLSDLLLYARTEMHIIASTYYFYSQQDSSSLEELRCIEQYMMLPLDTAQWCSYMYMLGTSDILVGDSVQVTLQEFDYLTHALTIAIRRGDKYFQANTLQSLATILEQPSKQKILYEHHGAGMDFISVLYSDKDETTCSDSLSLTLAMHSLELFREYKDRFQIANALRTIAELQFKHFRYHGALMALHEALNIISEQHSIESKRVPYWEASIYERLSLTYSALGDKQKSIDYRNRYLLQLEVMRQDLDEELRAEELKQYNYRLYLSILLIIFLVSIVSLVFYYLHIKVKRYGLKQDKQAEENLQITKEETSACQIRLANEKLTNIERRAKVGLVENIIPYINRMLKTNDMEYIKELSTEILHINDVLTDWIQVKRGKVAMNISTFPLQPLLDTISRNRGTYKQKKLSLDIPNVGNICVKGDRALTLFMINTLCDNARKFTPSGGTIGINVTSDDNVVEISVQDTGIGLSPENVNKINNRKVFRISKPDNTHDSISGEGGGFGFGLMNCKGIIAQMQKLSNRFQCCDFGVESQQGKGSRFWFRLPRILVLLPLVCYSIASLAETDFNAALKEYSQQVSANASARYKQAIVHGRNAIELIPSDSLYLRFLIENQMSISYQSLCLWDDYRRHNSQCLRLYRQYTADPNLPIYAKQLHTVKSEITWSVFFTLLLFLCSIFFLVIIARRSSRRRLEIIKQQELLLHEQETLNRTQYELDRIHIQNRILDNCLSTIKHETMYYPARIRQLALEPQTDKNEMFQLIRYYSEVLGILLEQAQKQTMNKLTMDYAVLVELKRRVMSAVSNISVDITVSEHDKLQEIRFKAIDSEIATNLFTPESGNLDAYVAREIIRMHDAACGYPGLRLYVENNEIIITLWKNSRLLSSKTFNWN